MSRSLPGDQTMTLCAYDPHGGTNCHGSFDRVVAGCSNAGSNWGIPGRSGAAAEARYRAGFLVALASSLISIDVAL
eukprot:5595721-Amphidinium_carterae.1